MRQLLKRHPGSRRFPVERVEVGITLPRTDSLVLSYAVRGKIGDVHLSPVTTAARGDKLWEHTCFEAFVRASSSPAYYEFNFAPSSQWAAYRFSAYRSGMCVATEISAPVIDVQSSPECYTLQASMDLGRLSALPRNVSWHWGLSALIEDTSGRKSYWALAHPSGKPDFHHAECFVYEFFPAVQP